MNFEEWEYHKSKRDLNGKTELAYLNELEQKFEKEIRDNIDRYAEYFEQYLPESVEAFISFYAKHKRSLVEGYEYYIKQNEAIKELRYREFSEKIFLAIILKKLFNIYLLWQAEKIKIPEIRMRYDFMFWEDEENLKDCPFVEEVTQEELDLLKMFLRDNAYSFDLKAYVHAIPSLFYVMDKDESGEFEYMPELFEYYDMHMGTGYLLDLLHLRSLKENYYMDLAFAKEYREEDLQPQSEEKPLKYLHYDNENILGFVNRYEDDYFKALEKGNQKFHEEYDEGNSEKYGEFYRDRVDDCIQLLYEAEDPVPVEGGLDWREALVRAANAYLNYAVINELDLVFAEYQLLRAAGVGKSISDIKKAYDEHYTIPIWENRLLNGREMVGEPRDFDF